MKQEHEEKWVADLRKRMEDYSEPLPEGLWNDIEKELDGPKVVPFGVRWRAAAVVFVLLVSSLAVWLWTSVSDMDDRNRMAEELAPVRVVQSEPEEGGHVADIPSFERPEVPDVVLAAPSVRRLAQIPEPSVNEEDADNAFATDSVQSQSQKVETEQVKASETEKVPVRSSRTSRSADREIMRRNASELLNKKQAKRNGKFGVGLLAGNTPYSSSATYGGMGRLAAVSSHQVGNLMGAMNDQSAAYSQILFENRELATKTDVNHHLPVTVGASFRWALNDDWALETGLMYTLLVSDSRSGETSYMEEEQRLHYVGIPLKVQRSIWKNNRFAFYASAGGAVEKCVSGKVNTAYVTSGGKRNEESGSMDVDPLQWSVTAGLGAQVNFNRQIGLYLEPGVVYYFDDNSGIETIRKEHPFNFNLQLGLRFSVGQ